MKLTEEQMILLHMVIHKLVDPHEGVRLNGQPYNVFLNARKNLRAIRVHDTLWIEQNLEKMSQYAALARAGARITWGIRDSGPWALIIDERVVRP